MVPARDGAAAPTDARARHPARSRRRGAGTAAQRQLRCRPVRVRRQHLVRPQRWIPEAARLLRPGGELVFLRYSVFLVLCAPDGDGQADDRLVRDYFGLHRLEWSGDESMEFALPFGEWLRLFRATGFDVLDLIELRPPAGDPLPARDQHLGAPLAEPGDLALAEAAMIRFGALLRQADNRWERIAESARICDDLGFHAIHFIDHLLAIPDPSGDILESWTTMTACATLTRRVRVSANVLCNSFRSPALLAKMGATLDVISGGRFELAMGAGWHEPEYHAYGFDFPSPGVRIAQLAEAVRLIKRLWTGEAVDFEGRHYRVRGGRCLPRPVQSPRPPIVIGGAGEKRMLRLVAEEADIWNASAGNYAQLDHKIAVLHEHCRAVGRDPASLELSLQDLVVIAPTEAALQAPLADARKRLSFFGDVDAIATIGTPDRCIDTLKRKTAQGISYFVCLFTDGGQPETVRLFGEKVLPAFR
jgi:F420-dependent oxidoreductase-like protein